MRGHQLGSARVAYEMCKILFNGLLDKSIQSRILYVLNFTFWSLYFKVGLSNLAKRERGYI